ncbi:hypothetical protein E4T49_07443 [Aureobasidium sp. EXF-10728]|nr:hypothetical protein E4T49_07443 [Aureobasidium sp. EXF-10728]
MSFRALFTAGLAAFAPLASAYTTPQGDPTGNAIYEPGLNSIVPVGKPFTITWEPDTKGKISLVLLHGPSTNVKPIQTIVESIDNTGSYDWTPDTHLAPNKTYYGIELIVEGTGQYQYSTQFGISNDNYQADSSSAGAVSTASATTTASVNIKSPVSAQAVSASDAVSSATSSVSSIAASGSSSVASQISSASSALASSASGSMSSASGSISSAASAHHSSATGAVSSAASSMSTATKSAASSAGSASKSVSSAIASSTGGAVALGAGFGGLAFAAAGAVAMVL